MLKRRAESAHVCCLRVLEGGITCTCLTWSCLNVLGIRLLFKVGSAVPGFSVSQDCAFRINACLIWLAQFGSECLALLSCLLLSITWTLVQDMHASLPPPT